MGTTRKSGSGGSNGEEKMGTEVKSVEGSISEGFDFGAVASDFNLKDVDLSILDAPDMEEFLKQPLHTEASKKVNEVTVRKTRKATRTLPEPTGELRNLYVIPSLRYGIVCLKIHADAHVTKEGAITIKKGTYVPAGRWSWDMNEAKTLLSKKINETISGYQDLINQYSSLKESDPPVREDGIDTYLRLCGRGKASIEKYVLGVNVLPDPKEEKVKEETTASE